MFWVSVFSYKTLVPGGHSSTPEQLRVEERLLLGRYRLQRVIGEGASGRVYLAKDTKAKGQVWAVKELDYRGVPEAELAECQELFHREATLLKDLRHPSLPRVEDHFQLQGRDYLVMERVEGPTLEFVLLSKARALEESKIWDLGFRLLQVLHYLHHRRPPILYRDLKPANVMLSVSGSVKLIDFGIARVVSPKKSGDTTAYGTPGFAPPEQYQGRTEPRSDVYALGMSLLRAATLYEAPELRFTHPKATKLNSDLSDSLGRILDRMVSKDAVDRPSTGELLPIFEAGRQFAPGEHQMQKLAKRLRRGFGKLWPGEERP